MTYFILAELAEKEHAFEIIVLLIFSIVILGVPTGLETKDYMYYPAFVLIPYVLFKQIAKDETLRGIIYRKRLINFEISLKKEKIKEEYYEMSKEAKEEIYKVDSKTNKSIEKFVINILLLVISVIFLLANYHQTINFSIIRIQSFEIKGQFIIIVTSLINLLNIYSSDREISQLLINYKSIYEKM